MPQMRPGCFVRRLDWEAHHQVGVVAHFHLPEVEVGEHLMAVAGEEHPRAEEEHIPKNQRVKIITDNLFYSVLLTP